MYKILLIFLLVIIGTSCASSSTNRSVKKFQRLATNSSPKATGIDLCPSCINEAVEIINVLLNLVLDEGIIESCGALCGALANKTGSDVLGDICDVACEAVGIDEYVHLLIKADLDPIYYCQLVKLCPINDHGDAKFINFNVLPKSAPDGSKFVIDCSFSSVNGTGMGTFEIVIVDPKNRTQDNLYWFEERPAGNYTERIGLDTLYEINCDPSQGLCDGWPLGTYNVTATLCNGECGSHHPHTSVYDIGKSSFELTKKKLIV